MTVICTNFPLSLLNGPSPSLESKDGDGLSERSGATLTEAAIRANHSPRTTWPLSLLNGPSPSLESEMAMVKASGGGATLTGGRHKSSMTVIRTNFPLSLLNGPSPSLESEMAMVKAAAAAPR